jgi:mRNA interferase HigB
MGAGYAFLVRVIALRKLRAFWEEPGHGDAEGPLRAWHAEAQAADWKTTAHIKARYRTASILKEGRVVFNIGGNKYRLVVHIRHPIVFIRFVGTHAAYDCIDAQAI